MSRPTKDQWALQLASITAARTTCCRRAVGCVLLNARGHVLATGYNGVAAGLPHCNESRTPRKWVEGHSKIYFPNACSGATSLSGTNLDGCQAIHAEQNALLQCKDIYSIDVCYVTTSPCMTCTKLLLNTSCHRIVYLDEYPQASAKELWESAGRIWEKVSLNASPQHQPR